MQAPGTRSRQGCLTCRKRHQKCDEGKPVCQLCQKTGRKCEYSSGFRWSTMSHMDYVISDRVGKTGSAADSPTSKRTNTTDRPSKPRPDLQHEHEIEPFNSTSRASPNNDHLPASKSIHNTTWESPPSGSRMDIQPPFGGADLIWDDLFSEQQLTDPMDPNLEADSFTASTEDDMLFIPLHDEGSSKSHKANLEEYVPSLDVACVGDVETSAMAPQLTSWLSVTLESTSEELALNYYLNDASTRIPALDGPKNPYRKLCLVAISYPLLLNTILYVSTVSMYNHGKANSEVVQNRRDQALLSLQIAAELLKSQKEHGGQKWMEQHQALSVLSLREVTLAAYLMHIVTEVMMGSQRTEAHLEAAYSLMTELDYVDRLPQAFYPRFLVQRFAMIDVVLSFLRHRRPLAPRNFALYRPIEEADEQEPSFRELTGCPQVVLSFLARVSTLADGTSFNDSAHLTEAYQLENEMRAWGSLRYPGPSFSQAPGSASQLETTQDSGAGADETCDLQLNTLSECFYWVAHLLLARRVFLDPTTSPRVQLYRRHLFTLMERLPPGCGPDSSLPFPFFMAAREAISDEDKDWVRQKHAEMLKKYPDQARELMMRLTEEIWRKNECNAASTTEDPLSTSSWVYDDIYIGVLDSQASHFVF